MSIRRRNGRWQFRGRNPDGSQHEKTFDRKVDADTYGVMFMAGKVRGEWTDPQLGKTAFGEWCAQWETTIVDLCPKTVERDLAMVRKHLVPRFGHTQLAKITTTSVKAWIAEWTASGTHAPATIRKAGQVMNKILSAAVDEGMIARNPAATVKLPQESKAEMRFLNEVELHQLTDSVDAPYDLLVLTAALTGMRWGELAGLRVRNIDVLQRRVTVVEQMLEVGGQLQIGPPKTKQSQRSVSIPPTLATMLGERLAACVGPEALVFVTEAGAPLRGTNFRRRIWAPALERSGLEGLRFHDLRHTSVAFAIADGAHAKAIQTRMGHASITTTLDTYGHLFPELDAQIGDGLERIFEHQAPSDGAPVVQLG
jgi:integrase